MMNGFRFNKGHLVTKKFAKMRDQVVFDCPDDRPISILMVSKEDALKCDVSNNFNQSLVGFCTPERKRINFVVRDFSLLPNVPIFKEGEEYYFICKLFYYFIILSIVQQLRRNHLVVLSLGNLSLISLTRRGVKY